MESGVALYKPQTAVAQRREMAKVPAVMGVLDPIEKTIFLASTDKTIAELSGVELANELTKALKYIAKDVGYRENDESERGYLIVRICEILKRYYSNLSLRDFRMAFEMSITGELDDFLPKGRDGQADRGHYQQFNAEYICKILNAYKSKRAGTLRKAYDAMPKPEPERDYEQERKYSKALRKEVCAAYEFFKENDIMPNMSPIAEMLYYQILADAKLAPEIEITIDEQKAILYRTINDFAKQGMVGDVSRLEKEGTDAPELQHKSFLLARRRALKDTFVRMKREGIILENYISE